MRLLPAVFAVVLTLPLAGQVSTPQPTNLPGMSPEAAAEFQRGTALISGQKFDQALEAFQKANRLAGGKCFLCLEAVAATHIRLNRYDDAIADALEAAKIAGSNEDRARADNQLGLAYAAKAKKDVKDSKELARAEEAFRKALRIDEKFNAPRFHLAKVLIREGRDKDADNLLDEYLKREPPGPLADQARALKENHRRATELFAPDFKLTTLDGKTITLASLKGKAVLLDFWATWSAPSLKALPELKNIRKTFAKEPFEIIGISGDRDRKTLEAFLKKNEITWPQFFDEGNRVSRDTFGVSTFPVYFVIDPEGVVVYRAQGFTPSTAARLTSEIRQALKKKGAKRG